MKMILQKIISSSGYCSRRQADVLIRAGQVKVNGQLAIIGDQADTENDTISVKGHLLAPPAKKIYIKLNKPLNYTCTNRHFQNEKNIFDLVNLDSRLFTVGRLDKNSHGLILLTNDGDLAQSLSHPKFQHQKVYEVKVKGEISSTDIIGIKRRFLKGIQIGEDQELARVKDITYLQNKTFIISLTEGKKRQIRLMFQAFDLKVIDLKRISLAGLELADLSEGRWKYLSPQEIAELKGEREKAK